MNNEKKIQIILIIKDITRKPKLQASDGIRIKKKKKTRKLAAFIDFRFDNHPSKSWILYLPFDYSIRPV